MTCVRHYIEPDGLDVNSDALLLADAFERHDVSESSEVDTDTLARIEVLCSDVRRQTNEFRQDVTDVLHDRLHHDQPVYGQYGPVQRTARRNRSLKDAEEVLAELEDAGIDREHAMSVDLGNVNGALEATELSGSDVYEVVERKCVPKTEVDEDVKESRLQG